MSCLCVCVWQVKFVSECVSIEDLDLDFTDALDDRDALDADRYSTTPTYHQSINQSIDRSVDRSIDQSSIIVIIVINHQSASSIIIILVAVVAAAAVAAFYEHHTIIVAHVDQSNPCLSAPTSHHGFAVVVRPAGAEQRVNLKEGGESLAVDSSNKNEYIDLVTTRRLFGAISEQTGAFLRGFHALVPPTVVRNPTFREALTHEGCSSDGCLLVEQLGDCGNICLLFCLDGR